MKYGLFDDATGLPISFHSDDVAPPPEGAVPITEEQWMDFLLHQGRRRWTGSDVEPYTPPRSLDDAKSERKAAATARRVVERERGVVVNGNRWHSDKGSADDISTAVAMARLYEAGQGEGTFRTIWKTADGFVTVTLSDLLAAGLAVGTFVQACFAREAAIFSEIEAAMSIEEVDAVSLDDGWPEDGTAKDASVILAIQQANARLERQAKELEQQGDTTGAALLRLQIKEV